MRWGWSLGCEYKVLVVSRSSEEVIVVKIEILDAFNISLI